MRHVALALVTAAALLGAPAARAQTLNQAGIARLNADVQALWAHDAIPMAEQQGLVELKKLIGQTHNVANICDATITEAHFVHVAAPVAPGLTKLDGSGIRGALPLSGGVSIAAEVRVHCHGCIFGIDWYDDFNVGIQLDNLAAGFAIDLDSSDPTAPKVTRIYPPTLAFTLRVTSTSDVVKYLGWITSSLVNPIGRAVATVALDYLSKKVNVTQVTPQVAGLGSTLAPVAPADLEGSAVKLERDLVAHKMPFGDCVEGKFDRDYNGTWEDSLNDPAFNPGNLDLVKVDTADDAACDTGWYLGGLAFRYGATHSPEALAHAKQVIATYVTLFNMRGTPGDLNRSITPVGAGIAVDTAHGYFVGTYQGKQYILSNWVSRDAYTGAFFGCSLAHDLIDDPQAKADAGNCVQWGLDYLLANHWTNRKKDGSYDQQWVGCLDQQYAWVLAAYRCNPAKYAAVLDQYKGYSDLIWTGVWLSVLDPFDQYFKYDLGAAALHTALRCETDPVRWQRVYQALAMMRHFVGHHQNAQLNSIYLAADASSVARLGVENANLLTRWLRQPRRYLTHDLRSDPTIEKVTYTLPFDPNSLFPGAGIQQSTVMAKYPIPVEKRISAGERWDRSPYSLHEDYLWGPEARHEGESLDYLLPYWMARFYGAIPAPRVRGTVTGVSVSPAATGGLIR
jgi:hypothetical protein